MSRLILLFIFWIMLVMAIITSTAPGVMRGGMWEAVGAFFEESLASDLQKREMAVRRSQKLVKNYIDLLKELYGTKFLLAENAADLAERYALIIRNDKQNNSESVPAMMDGYVNLLQSQSVALGGAHSTEVVGISDDMINNFRALEQRLGDRQKGREAYQMEIDKLAAIKNSYARGLEKVAAQKAKIRAMQDRIRELNGRLSEADRMNAERERLAAVQEVMMRRNQAVQERMRSLRDEQDAIRDRQAEQQDRIEAMQQRMNSRLGR